MNKLSQVDFSGKLEKSYTFDVYDLNSDLDSIAAVYIVSLREMGADKKYVHTVIYIGETDDLKKRFADHEKWPCFKKNKANALCVHPESSGKTRLDIETDLRATRDTDCNKQ